MLITVTRKYEGSNRKGVQGFQNNSGVRTSRKRFESLNDLDVSFSFFLNLCYVQ